MKHLVTFLFFVCFPFLQKANAQVSVTATGGTTGPTSYTNFINAFNAINAGTHTGSITVKVTAGFTQSGATSATLNASGNGAASYTDITIKPETGTNPIITCSGDNTAAIKLNGADNVTIDGSNNGTTSRNLTFVNSNGSGSGRACNIWLASNGTDGATNNIIRNCKVLGSSGSGAAYVGVCVYSSQTTLTLYNSPTSNTTGANSNNLIQNNLFNSANAAVVFNGGAGIGETGNQVIGNEIGDATSSTARKFTNAGVFMLNQDNFIVSGNTFTWQNTTNRNVAPGSISIGDGCTNGSIVRNNIKTVRFAISNDTTLAGGILLNAGFNANINVHNNFITDLASKGSTTPAYNAYGIAIGMGSGYNIAYNSVNMGTNPTATASGYQAALYVAAGVSGLSIQNNLFIHSGTNTTNKFSIYSVDANPGSSVIGYNDYYTSAATLAYAGSNQNTLSDVQANFQNGNSNSRNVLPVFIASTDLHLEATNGYNTSNLAGAGTPITGITTDYDNNVRNASPTIGAHEIMAVTCNAPYAPTVTNVAAFSAVLNWSQTGSPVNYEIKYGAQGFDVTTAGTSVFTTTKPYTLNPPLTASTNYSYYVRAICTAGDTSAWSAVTNFSTPVSCFAPTTPTATGITKNSATFNWTSTGTPIDYEIRYGAQGFDVNTAGTSVFTTTRPYTLNAVLAPATNYSYYVRAICNTGDTSLWSPVSTFTTLCDYPDFSSTTNGNVCGTGTATLDAATTGSGSVKWYENATGGIALGVGNSFVTPVISSTTNYYAEAYNTSGTVNVGRNNAASPPVPTVSPNNNGQGVAFTALKDITIDSVGIWVGTSTAQAFTVQLLNSSNTVLNTFNLTTPANASASGTAPVKTYFTLNVLVATGTGYKLIVLANGGVLFGRENSGVTSTQFNTYTSSLVNVTSGVIMPSTLATTNYYFFYNLAVSGTCTNPIRQAVTAMVTSNPLTALPDTSGTCNGIAAELNSGSANTTWAPASVLYTNAAATAAYTGGAMQTVYAKVTTPTTVYATTTSGSCTFNDSVYIDLQTGTAVDVTAAASAMNCGDALAVSLTSNTPVSWRINGGNLYTDANGTTAYTAGTASTNVFVKSNNNRYVKGFYEVGGCTFSDSAFVMVNNPATVILANTSGAGNTDSSVVNGVAADMHNADCELMATLTPTGGTPLSGIVSAKITMDGSVQNTATGPYVTRHFEITPDVNGASAQADITLYFTQSEFDAYNTYVTNNGNNAVNPLLPSNPSGSTANILVDKFNAAGGSPSPTNNNSAQVITPTSVTWDATNNWWAVTFPTTGFSGFFLHTNVSATPLPIVWKYVTAALNHQKQAVVNWAVAEKEAKAYLIEKSLDGHKFENIASVSSKGNGINSYSYAEPEVLNGKAWYRIAQQSVNGTMDYSTIMMLQNSAIYGQVTIYPNPATQVLNVEVDQANVSYSIFDLQGKMITKGLLQSGKNIIDIARFAKGFYTIRIGETVQKFIMQ